MSTLFNKINDPLLYTSQTMLEDVSFLLQNKLDDLLEREPDTDGYRHEKWEERCSDLEAIVELVEDLINETDNETRIQLHEEIKDQSDVYQLIWGGLKR